MVASCWEWWEEKGRSGIFVMAEQILIRTVVTQSYTCDKMWQKCTHPVPTSQAWALMLHWSSIHTYWGCEWKVHGNTLPAAAAKSLRLCPTLWDSIDGSPPGSPVPGILQARTLEWVVISSSGESSDPGNEPVSPEFPALKGKFFITGRASLVVQW